jgi:SAM-dependent methyltransferase
MSAGGAEPDEVADVPPVPPVPRTLRTLGAAHGALVHGRRVRRLAEAIAPLLEPGWSVVDVGCGDGRLAALVAELRGGLDMQGLELSVRGETHVPVRAFDGRHLPLDDRSVDAVVLVDVLHHTDDPAVLLREAARVARRAVVLKDHRTAHPFARPTLRFMDWVGNRAHGVPLPYHYWSERQWRAAWQSSGLDVASFRTKLGLYPWPASWVFESGLHFVAKLVPRGGA